MMILAPIAAGLIQMAISRSREFEAEAHPATAHLFIVNPINGEKLANVFATHPLTSERVARLRTMH